MNDHMDLQQHFARVRSAAAEETQSSMPAGFAERVLARRPAWEREQREVSMARLSAVGAMVSMLIVAFAHFQSMPKEPEPAFAGWLEMEPLDEPDLWE